MKINSQVIFTKSLSELLAIIEFLKWRITYEKKVCQSVDTISKDTPSEDLDMYNASIERISNYEEQLNGLISYIHIIEINSLFN